MLVRNHLSAERRQLLERYYALIELFHAFNRKDECSELLCESNFCALSVTDSYREIERMIGIFNCKVK